MFKIEESSNGRSYLLYRGDRIAECINGDHKERFGGLSGWIDKVQKRTENRIKKIEDQQMELERERQRLCEMDYHLFSEIGKMRG